MFDFPNETIVNKKNITEFLVKQIVSGKIKHNEVMPNEIDFAAQFGVSRTMIRDVLKSLEGKGLIERKKNLGTRVRSIHSWNLLDKELLEWSKGVLTQSRFLLSLMELRLIIEPQAAALAAVRANDKDLMGIRENLSRMENFNKDQGVVTLDTEADIDFHESIIKACGNLFLSQFGSAIQGALYHTIYLSNKNQINHEYSLECHRQVLLAIEDRDPKRAYSSMCRVLNNAISDLNLQITGVILTDYCGHEKG